MALAALAEFHEADRNAEEAGNPVSLVITDGFQMPPDALGSGVDTKQGLGERAFLANR